MNPAQLRTHCDSLKDETGTRGQAVLAKRLKWSARTMTRKLSGDSPIHFDEEVAIRCLMGCCGAGKS